MFAIIQHSKRKDKTVDHIVYYNSHILYNFFNHYIAVNSENGLELFKRIK